MMDVLDVLQLKKLEEVLVYRLSEEELKDKDKPVKLYSVLNGLLKLKNNRYICNRKQFKTSVQRRANRV